jgi:hypothetical protein
VKNWFQSLLSNSTCTATQRQQQREQQRRRANDPRAQERAEYEASLRRAVDEGHDTNSSQYEMNRAKCSGASNVFGDFLYEVKGNRNGGDGARAAGARPSTAGPLRPSTAASWHSNYY